MSPVNCVNRPEIVSNSNRPYRLDGLLIRWEQPVSVAFAQAGCEYAIYAIAHRRAVSIGTRFFVRISLLRTKCKTIARLIGMVAPEPCCGRSRAPLTGRVIACRSWRWPLPAVSDMGDGYASHTWAICPGQCGGRRPPKERRAGRVGNVKRPVIRGDDDRARSFAQDATPCCAQALRGDKPCLLSKRRQRTRGGPCGAGANVDLRGDSLASSFCLCSRKMQASRQAEISTKREHR